MDKFTQYYESKFVGEALTFDDVLISPAYSNILPSDVVTATKLTNTISLNIPILDGPVTKGKLDVSVILQYGVGINQIGNTVILGNNLQDGTKFSDIDELSVGDYIIITDINDNVVNYKVSNVYETSDSDTSFMERDTGGKMGITLSTSNDDGSMRLIVTAEETDDVVEVPSIDNDNNNSNNNF